MVRWSLRANPANIQYIRYYESYDPEDLEELWSVASTRFQELFVAWSPECSLSSIVQCLAARHTEFTVQDLKLRSVERWDYFLLSFTLSFTNLVSVHIDFEDVQDPPTAQTVVDILHSLPLKGLIMSWVSDWRLDIGEDLPKLEYLQIQAEESLEEFDGDCWLELSGLMDRWIRYNCSSGEGFTDLYEDVLSYAGPEGLDPAPVIRWLAIGQMFPKFDSLVNFSGLNTSQLITALSSIADLKNLRLRIDLHPGHLHEVFRHVPKSVKYLILSSYYQISPSLFLEFFQSLSKVEVLKIFITINGDGRVIWPAGYFTNASASFSNHPLRLHFRLSVRGHFIRDHLPRWAIDNDNQSLIERSIESFEASFTNLNEEIMGWFRMKESLKHMEILCTTDF